MNNDRNRVPTSKLTAAEVAAMVEGELKGSGDIVVDGVDCLDDAEAGKVAFLGNAKYKHKVGSTSASVILVPPDFPLPSSSDRAWVLCADPSAAFTRLVEHFAPRPPPPVPGVHASAVVADGVRLPPSVSVGPGAVIEEAAEIGENSVIGAGCYIGYAVKIGVACQIAPNVTIREFCRLGDRVIVHSGVVIGSDGFGFTPGSDGHVKIPQRGIVQIDDDVEIGSLTTIDRARFGRTWIKRGVKIDNLVQIAHNVVIGEHSLIVAQVGISGSTRLGRGVVVGGQAGISGHLEIGDGAMIMGQSGVAKNLPPSARVGGAPAMPEREYARLRINLNRLDNIKQELRKLRQEVTQWQERDKDRAGPVK